MVSSNGERVTLRAYAAHRASRGLRGKSLSGVQKAIATGRITEAVDDDGKINVELADRLWRERTLFQLVGPRGTAAAAPSAPLEEALRRGVIACAATGCTVCSDAVQRGDPLSVAE